MLHRFSTIVLSRFFLNLRAAASVTLPPTMPSSLSFAHAVEEFGCSLRFVTDEKNGAYKGEVDAGELEHGEETSEFSSQHDIDNISSSSIALCTRPPLAPDTLT